MGSTPLQAGVGLTTNSTAMGAAIASLEANQGEFLISVNQLKQGIIEELGLENGGDICNSFVRYFTDSIVPELSREYDSLGNAAEVMKTMNDIFEGASEAVSAMVGRG